jgi:2-haloacid dehalogenase
MSDAPMAGVYVFDAYGTLFDVAAAIARFKDEVGPQADRIAELWRIKQLEYTWTYSLMGRYRDFRDLTAAALDTAAAMAGGLPDGLRAKLLAAYEELDAYPDVAPALQRLRAHGARTAILSNGSSAMLGNAVRAAGLVEHLDAVLAVDPVAIFKPRAEVYALVERHFGIGPADVSFQSSNRWDIAGAAAFGFRTIWINRTGKPDEYRDLPPDRVVASLEQLP